MPQGKVISCDIAVVGGGILGLSIATLAVQGGYTVRALRLNDQGRPRADTLRNQGWLQSGLMYIDRFGDDRSRGRALARRMYFAGRRMLRDLRMPLPTASDRGIIRLNSEEEAARLEEDASYLRIRGVERLNATLAERRLGNLYEDGIFYLIPDAPFPEDRVLTRLRELAQERGAEIIQSTTPARLVDDSDSASGVGVECQIGGADYQIRSKVTIAAAGAGNWPLLRELGLEPAMKLRQTPLLVLHETLFADVTIFADRTRKFSFVRHPPDGQLLPRGALVLGTNVHQDVSFQTPDSRRIEPADCEKFGECLPPVLRERIPDGRFTAGYEVIPDKTIGLKDVESWVEWVKEYPALIKAAPGRATMGMAVARQILDEIASRIGAPSKARSPFSRTGVSWDGDIFMHYHPNYSFNDSE